MRYLVVHYDNEGDIKQAYISEVSNSQTYAADGRLTLGDGRSRALVYNVRLYAVDDPLCNEVISWRNDDRFYADVATGELWEYADWTPPDTSPPPPSELLYPPPEVE